MCMVCIQQIIMVNDDVLIFVGMSLTDDVVRQQHARSVPCDFQVR